MSDQNFHIDAGEFLISINDIRDKYFAGAQMDKEELLAMQNYDKFRLAFLNASKNEADFDQRYFQLQVMANLHQYTDFLDYDQLLTK